VHRRAVAADLQRQRHGPIRCVLVELDPDGVGAGRQRETAVVDHPHRLRIGPLSGFHADDQLRQRIEGSALVQRIVDH
jgi:hypothetical protein